MSKQGIFSIIVALLIVVALIWFDDLADHQVKCREAEVTLVMTPSTISYHQATLKLIESYIEWTKITNDYSMDANWAEHKHYALKKIQLNEDKLAYAKEFVKDCS